MHEDTLLYIVDQIEKYLYRVNLNDGTSIIVGRHGTGPGEYILPSAAFLIGSDSLALWDVALRRFLLFDVNGIPAGVVRPPAFKGWALPRTSIDHSIFWEVGTAEADGTSSDSSDIRVWNFGDTATYFALRVATGEKLVVRTSASVAGSTEVGNVVIPQPFSAVDLWWPRGDGLVTLRSEPARMELWRDGRAEVYKELSFPRPKVTESDVARFANFKFRPNWKWPARHAPFGMQPIVQDTNTHEYWTLLTVAAADSAVKYAVLSDNGHQLYTVRLPKNERGFS